MSVSLIASVSMTYAGRALKPGDRFDARRQDARALAALGRAKPAPEEKPKRTYKRRDMTAESASEAEADAE